jgi:hypothetical protein
MIQGGDCRDRMPLAAGEGVNALLIRPG